ncbi:hypothetical protein E5843_00875 [Luteimonas yindakuii]|uniref:I78 family peptidase inhibitor n=1 Tax=Luteimonas yindakuii TaxID=2565782 RepID=UPI0010A3E379|nr:I78 family peptidase inhibitor [Luteimonas yindakuii]QCO66710.1 hypothetical protein E5843_00875 [Luteimonas yindakuii]
MTRSLPSVACTTALLALTACAGPRDAVVADTVATPVVTERCDASRAQAFVGQAATSELVERARAAAGAATARTLRPDQMVTLEYLEGRLNIRVDEGDVVTAIDCG